MEYKEFYSDTIHQLTMELERLAKKYDEAMDSDYSYSKELDYKALERMVYQLSDMHITLSYFEKEAEIKLKARD